MRAIVLREHGGPEVLHEEQIDTPEPGPGEVRVRIRAVALNHLDLWVRRGGPAFKLVYPHRLGSDIAGTIDAIGAGTSIAGLGAGARVVVQPGLSCGRCAACLGGHDNLCREYRILGENAQGGYAEYITVPAGNLVAAPANLDDAHAAASLLTFLTAWQMVVHKARAMPGDVVVVNAVGSGVGVAALQIAKLHGATVIATASTQAKLDRARELGADHIVDSSTADVLATIKQVTARRGADAVIDSVGGETFATSLRAVRPGGRVVTCGATAGFHPAIDLRQIFFRQVEVLGSTMGSKADLLAVLGHVAAGRLRPIVHAVLPLARAADAHRLLEERQAFGKVVLEP
jgi:NADPH:quinone reductase-like Zn-dependent oxidoreductase